LAVALLMLGTASAQVPNERCIACHGQQLITSLPVRFSDGVEVLPYVDAATYVRSVHAKLACVECHQGSHPEFNGSFGPRTFPTRREYVREIEQACWKCHQLVDKTNDGMGIGHSGYLSGDAPLCSDCHPAHKTRSVTAQVTAGQVMEASRSWGTMFATKGVEYLLVIVYAAMFIPFAILLYRIAQQRTAAPLAEPAIDGQNRPWFQLPEGFSVHRGHAWALAEGNGVFRIGMDDFAGRLIGEPTAMMLPSRGRKLDQGERGWQVRVNGNILDVLSPVRGEVLEVNEQAVNSPSVVAQDPYGQGWLMKVRAPRPRAAVANLLSGRLARAWYDEVEDDVRDLMHDRLGTVLQDGGIPVNGFARELAGDRWFDLAATFLLTADPTESPQ
jgi:glycine cleavage system H lipoate-binding protein